MKTTNHQGMDVSTNFDATVWKIPTGGKYQLVVDHHRNSTSLCMRLTSDDLVDLQFDDQHFRAIQQRARELGLELNIVW